MMSNERLNKFGKELGELLEFQNISINDYAERIGTTSKNLIDIIEGRVSLSQPIIYNISFISDIPTSYILNVEQSYSINKKIDNYLNDHDISIRQYINKFDYKDLPNTYGISYNNEQNDYSIARSILKYLRLSDPNQMYNSDGHIFYKSKNDKPELLALWLERCFKVVQEQEIKEYSKENIPKLVKFIREEAKERRFDKNRLIKEFNENGIFLAIEPDLKGAKIRGAFRVLNNKPAIYLTTRTKRIADIYFALLHELAHCKSDFNRAKNGSIISMIDSNGEEDYELKADETALNWMISDTDYNNIKNGNGYHYEVMPFLVYRLALDNIISYSSKKYQDNNPLIKE